MDRPARLLTAVSCTWVMMSGVLLADGPAIRLIRTPDGGIQPQAAVDDKGVVHLIYYKGDPKAGDVYYVKSSDDGKSFSKPIRVNSEPHTAVAMGTIRGAQLALGRQGHVHVAWNGSQRAIPAGTREKQGASPMLYTRLNDEGTAFEPQRNLMTKTHALDGGGSVAADAKGNVYLVWHGLEQGSAMREEERAVWVARSSDDGKTFAAETRANKESTGACGCCGLRAATDAQGRLLVMYRTATQFVNRDMRLLRSNDQGKTFDSINVHRWRIDKCPMSSAAISPSGDTAWLGWETDGRVYFQPFTAGNLKPRATETKANSKDVAKHPVVIAGENGQTLMVWTEGAGWNRGGTLAWQVYDKEGQLVEGAGGRKDGIPVWSFASAWANRADGFTVVH